MADVVRVCRLAAMLYVASGIAVGIPVVLAAATLAHATRQAVLAAVTVLAGLGLFWIARTPRVIERAYAPLLHAYMLLGTALVTLGQHSVGERYDIGAMLYVEVAIFAFYLLRRPWALAHMAVVGAAYFGLLVVWERDDLLLQWLFLMSAISVIGVLVGQAMERSDRLGAELAELNATLEHRVEEQVGEVERLGRLRRFLSPQVADAVLGADEMLQPHRRRIAVVFCDLRGFTRFAGNAEPEDVAEVLTAYYEVVGELVRKFEATVGTFAGDGIMAYFNDPVPCDDPPGRALDLACSLRPRLDALVERWGRSGFDLGYGVGVAYGYATLGTIGFEGRYDYTAVGTVVNLAARLCGEAAPGEVLVDQRTYEAVSARVAAEPRAVPVKGLGDAVRVYSVAT
jgi:class 3 adenylate cyclase